MRELRRMDFSRIGTDRTRRQRQPWLWPAALLAVILTASPAFALSEIQPEDDPPPSEEEVEIGPPAPEVLGPIPLPDPVVVPRGERESEDAPANEPAELPDREVKLPEIIYDEARLPEPVRRMRELIMEACRSGDIEALRPLLGTSGGQTQLSFGGVPDDPIAFLREVSGDEHGHEILAILHEVLEAGYVHLDAGTPREIYLWPYFFALPIDELSGRQRVELFMLVTAADYEDMKNFGAYIFYRVGITPDGSWQFFVAGD